VSVVALPTPGVFVRSITRWACRVDAKTIKAVRANIELENRWHKARGVSIRISV
jgi:hypothetical protein